MILDVEWVQRPGGEAAVAMECVARIRPLIPGAQGLVWDGALRGTHKQELLHKHGLIPFVKVAVKHAARDTPDGVIPSIPKEAHIEDKSVTLRDGTTKLCRVFAVGGAACLSEPDLRGKPTFVAIGRGKIQPKQNADGSYRWYGEYALPQVFGGGGTMTLRLDTSDDDRLRGLNRTEVLSPIPASDEDFRKVAWLRRDAESNNAAFEDRLYNKRAHSVGHLSQKANMLGFALLTNSLTLYLARRRGGVRAGPPPTGRKLVA